MGKSDNKENYGPKETPDKEYRKLENEDIEKKLVGDNVITYYIKAQRRTCAAEGTGRDEG